MQWLFLALDLLKNKQNMKVWIKFLLQAVLIGENLVVQCVLP